MLLQIVIVLKVQRTHLQTLCFLVLFVTNDDLVFNESYICEILSSYDFVNKSFRLLMTVIFLLSHVGQIQECELFARMELRAATESTLEELFPFVCMFWQQCLFHYYVGQNWGKMTPPLLAKKTNGQPQPHLVRAEVIILLLIWPHSQLPTTGFAGDEEGKPWPPHNQHKTLLGDHCHIQ